MEKKLLEAALFMSSKPVHIDELMKIIKTDSQTHVKELVDELRNDYQDRGMVITETPYGYHMQVERELLPEVSHLTPYADLSDGCKRTLALAVYKEPITQSDVIKIQGNKGYTYIRELIDMGLIKGEKFGRTKLLKLTVEFERYFGMKKEHVRAQLEKELGKEHRTIASFVEKSAEPQKTQEKKQKVVKDPGLSEKDIQNLSTGLKVVVAPKIDEETEDEAEKAKKYLKSLIAAAPTQAEIAAAKTVHPARKPPAKGQKRLALKRTEPLHNPKTVKKSKKAKKDPKAVRHESAVDEKTRDSKNIFSEEGEIDL